MLDKLTNGLDLQGHALLLRAERQRLLASNIANADTPGYVARDMKFAEALTAAAGGSGSALSASQGDSTGRGGASQAGHIPLSGFSERSTLGYAVQTQPALDNNSVDMDRERASAVDNALKYETTLRFINSSVRNTLDAIKSHNQ